MARTSVFPAKRIGLRTDASAKFEKGLDPNNAEEAINRACQLIEELGAGEVVGGMVDVYARLLKSRYVSRLSRRRINALLGTDISAEEMLGYFKKIDLGYDEKTNEIIAPTFRQDLFRTADLAEEVARFFGYAQYSDDSADRRSDDRKAVRSSCVCVQLRRISQSSADSPRV